MAALRVRANVELKNKLSNTLRNWLPILHSSLSDLGDAMSPFVESNPLIEIRSGYEESFSARIPKKIQYGYVQNSHSEAIEALTIAYRSLYDVLEEQMEAPLFPTPLSQAVATALGIFGRGNSDTNDPKSLTMPANNNNDTMLRCFMVHASWNGDRPS